MFGPNTYFQEQVNINYSHRDKIFFDLFAETRTLFSDTFQLNEYDVLFVPGSATVGIEALMFSLKSRIKLIGNDGAFKSRWIEMESVYADKPHGKRTEMFCLLETSCSKNFSKDGCLVDAISGFPYFDIPPKTIAFVTCLNKQVGSYVGLSVVCVRKNCWKFFINEKKMSYLNLARYKSYHEINQAPSTSPTFIYEHLFHKLQKFNLKEFREKLDIVAQMIVDAVGEENIIGNSFGPVITLKDGTVPEQLARKYNIYGYWAGRPNYQIFTYTQEIADYEMFLKELKNYKTGGCR